MLFTFCSFKISIYFNLLVTSACSSLSKIFRKFKSGSRINGGYDALFFYAIFRNCGDGVIIKFSVSFVFL